MTTLKGQILTLPKMSGSVSTPKSLSGNVGAKTINIGEKGDDGATFTPSVSADGIISWTNDKDLPNPEPVNIKGEKGADGQPGADGKDYVLTDADKQEIAGMVEVPEGGSTMPNDLEQIVMLVDTDMLPAVHIGGAILTDNSGRVILRY